MATCKHCSEYTDNSVITGTAPDGFSTIWSYICPECVANLYACCPGCSEYHLQEHFHSETRRNFFSVCGNCHAEGIEVEFNINGFKEF